MLEAQEQTQSMLEVGDTETRFSSSTEAFNFLFIQPHVDFSKLSLRTSVIAFNGTLLEYVSLNPPKKRLGIN